jgi:hypothetical protein
MVGLRIADCVKSLTRRVERVNVRRSSRRSAFRAAPDRLIRPHRLEAQDSALSRRQHGFESRWGRHIKFNSVCDLRVFGLTGPDFELSLALSNEPLFHRLSGSSGVPSEK